MSLNAAAFSLLAGTKGLTPPQTSLRAHQQAAKAADDGSKSRRKQTAKVGPDADAMLEFLYDKDLSIVGMRLAPPNSLNSYPVRQQKHAESYLVTAKAFLTFHNIPTEKMRRFEARIYEGGILGFSLKDDEMK
jgi:hypothetical protein